MVDDICFWLEESSRGVQSKAALVEAVRRRAHVRLEGREHHVYMSILGSDEKSLNVNVQVVTVQESDWE
jgi:hypothetical protein